MPPSKPTTSSAEPARSRLRELYARAARQAIPIEVMIELTHHCNFRCQHCYIPDFGAPDRLPTARVLTLLEELAEMGTLVLALSGGELFLRRDWLPIARRARELGFELHLFTNASLVGEEEADAIRDLHAVMQVSLYSMEEATFDEITARPGSFRKVIAGIERLRARGVRVILKAPMMSFNYRQVAAVRAYAESIGAECRVSPFITAKKDGHHAPLALRVAQEEVYSELGGPAIGCHVGRSVDPDAPLCAAASRYACITSSGDVMACNILPGADGNVRETSFREVWEGSAWLQKIRSIRARDLHTCGSCESLAHCGRCHAQALVEDGDLYGPSSFAQRRAELLAEVTGSETMEPAKLPHSGGMP